MAQITKIPGVFVTEVTNPDLTVPQTQIRSVGIVGLATDYVVKRITVSHTALTYSETITEVESADIQSVVGLYLGDIVVPTSYYTVSGNVVTWDSSAYDYIDKQSQYTAVLRVTKGSTYYEPIVWYAYNQTFNDTYGYPVMDNAINQIPAAASLAFDSGAVRVVTVQASSGSVTDIKTALDKLENEDVQIVVMPGITSASLQTYLRDHVDNMSSPDGQKERIGFIAPTSLTDSVSTITAQSESFANQRIVNIAPGGIDVTLTNGSTDATLTVSSIYAGASLAGRLANPNIRTAKPLTREIVSNVSNPNYDYIKYEREILAGAGTLVLHNDRALNVRVNQGLTTDTSNYNNNEISVVLIKDSVRTTLRETLDDEFIGEELDPNKTPASVESSVNRILNGMKGTTISDYKDVSAVMNSSDPTAVDVSCWISVIRPFNYINLTFTVYV